MLWSVLGEYTFKCFCDLDCGVSLESSFVIGILGKKVEAFEFSFSLACLFQLFCFLKLLFPLENFDLFTVLLSIKFW